MRCWRQGPCLACDLSALSLQGSCLPGRYSFLYTATSLDGSSTATAVRTVVVYRSTSINFQLDVATEYTTNAAAAAAAASIVAGNASSVEEAVAVVLSTLGPAASDVHSSDVLVEGATSGPHPSGNFSVTVNVTVSFYEPDGVHSWQVQQAAAAWTLQRRQLLGSPGGNTASHTGVCKWKLHGSNTCSAAAAERGAADSGIAQPAALEGVTKPAAGATLQAGEWATTAMQAAHRQVVAAVSGLQEVHPKRLFAATRGRQLLASNATSAAAAAAAAASCAGASGVSTPQGQPTDEIGVSFQAALVHQHALYVEPSAAGDGEI